MASTWPACSGSILFKLGLAYGLEQGTSFVPVEDFFSEACTGTDGKLTGEIVAEVLGFDVYTFEFPEVELFSAGCDVGSLASGGAGPLGGGPSPIFQPVINGGATAITKLQHHSAPQIAIDPVSGDATYLQVSDTDATVNGVFGQLNFTRRHNGTWSAMTPLPSANHISNPALAFTHDGAGGRAVAVYQAYNQPGSPMSADLRPVPDRPRPALPLL